MTEKEKMLAGEIYSAVDPQLIEELTEVKKIIHDYNLLRPSEKLKHWFKTVNCQNCQTFIDLDLKIFYNRISQQENLDFKRTKVGL